MYIYNVHLYLQIHYGMHHSKYVEFTLHILKRIFE